MLEPNPYTNKIENEFITSFQINEIIVLDLQTYIFNLEKIAGKVIDEILKLKADKRNGQTYLNQPLSSR